jgi:ankyrin repeat protein
VDIIRELKSFGIDMNQVDGDDSDNKDLPSQQTALHYACLGLNGPGGYNWNRDGWPCEPGIRPVIVKALLDCGTDPNKGNSHGMTPLHDLVYHDRSADEWVVEENRTLARMLIAYGAEVTILNHDGRSVCDVITDDVLYVLDDDDDWIPDLVMLDICINAHPNWRGLNATQDH